MMGKKVGKERRERERWRSLLTFPRGRVKGGEFFEKERGGGGGWEKKNEDGKYL